MARRRYQLQHGAVAAEPLLARLVEEVDLLERHHACTVAGGGLADACRAVVVMRKYRGPAGSPHRERLVG